MNILCLTSSTIFHEKFRKCSHILITFHENVLSGNVNVEMVGTLLLSYQVIIVDASCILMKIRGRR